MINQGKEIQEEFLAELRFRIPERGKLANFLIDALCIEKEAVYRRLRGEVSFTFAEIIIIANKLHISIDSLYDITLTNRGSSFHLYGYNFFNMTEADYEISKQLVSIVKMATESPHCEYGFASSIVPLPFSTYYRSIFRLYMLRQMYQFGKPGLTPAYVDVVIPEVLQGYHDEYLEEVQRVKQTTFILDNLLMLYVVNDVKYFNSIQLITNEEVVEIKEELDQFLRALEMLAHRGCYDSGNEVYIYISNLNFDATYAYLYSENVNLSMITTFSLSAVTSLDRGVCENMRVWIQALKRTSTLISKCSEIDRAIFFKKQREYLYRI